MKHCTMSLVDQPSWKRLWNNRKIPNQKQFDLQSLIEVDGFDNGVGSYNEASWREMVRMFAEQVNLKTGDKVLEIGCGGGAFLFALSEILEIDIHGIDYSESLVSLAKKAVPHGHFKLSEADKSCFSDCKFDILFSHSVFHYFPNHKYAQRVISTWLKKLKVGGKFVLMDLNDARCEIEYNEKRAQEFGGLDKYLQTYNGLHHLFFDRKKLEKFLRSNGMQDVIYFPHVCKDYGNSKFRFNLMCTKNWG